MFKNYLKMAIRNMMKYKSISLINITGLSIGLAIVMLVFLNVHFQFSFDKCHEKLERIYLAKLGKCYATPSALADYVRENIPEVENSVRFEDWKGRKALLSYKNESMIIRNIIFTDPSVFEIFSFKIVAGDIKAALKNPYSLVLSESESKKVFGSENPVGKVVRLNSEHDYTITAVVEDAPANASHVYGGFVPFEERLKLSQNWNGWYYQTYFLLAENQDAGSVEQKVKALVSQFYIDNGEKDDAVNNPVGFFPMKDVYFNSETSDHYRHGNKQTAYLFITIGLFILCLAVLNYINLATARAFTRMKEIAIRKTVGSQKKQLIGQFLIESVLMSLLASGVGIFLLELSLPFVNRFTLSSRVFEPFNHPWLLLLVFGGAALVGLIAGIFPSFYLTSIGTTHALKRLSPRTAKSLNLRKALIIFQFSISIILLIATLTIMKQRNFIQTKDLGFDKEQIMWFNLNDAMQSKKEIFRNMLMTNPNILNVSYTQFNEADANNYWGDEFEGRKIRIHPFWVDANYINLMGLKIVEGRDFSDDFIADPNQSIILNEAAVRQFEMDSPIGKQVFDRTIIGIVEDFNYQSLHHHIEPLGLIPMSGVNKANIKISTENVSATLSFIEEKWKTLSPDYPLEYHFLDESYGYLYESERKTGMLFNFFSLVALLIACMGLYGLASFSAEQRTKEIGIRKTLGASISGVVMLLTKDFTKWIVFANLIAWPIAWYAMNKWLQDFAYRIDMSWWMFVLSGGIALVIALATVSFQAIKAATANPVDSLRFE
jgi:putative ABC transport system permease protein